MDDQTYKIPETPDYKRLNACTEELSSRGIKAMMQDSNCAFKFEESIQNGMPGYLVIDKASNEALLFILGRIES
jgi:hypothetical protein